MANEVGPVFCCANLVGFAADPEVPLVFNNRFREFGLKILDGGTAVQEIRFCPWCGKRLAESLRDQWFERLSKLGLEPGDPDIPQSMLSDAWYSACSIAGEEIKSARPNK